MSACVRAPPWDVLSRTHARDRRVAHAQAAKVLGRPWHDVLHAAGRALIPRPLDGGKTARGGRGKAAGGSSARGGGTAGAIAAHTAQLHFDAAGGLAANGDVEENLMWPGGRAGGPPRSTAMLQTSAGTQLELLVILNVMYRVMWRGERA